MSAPNRLPSSRALAKWLVTCLMLVTTSVASFAAQSGELVIGKTYADSKPGTAPTLPVAKGVPI